MLTITDLETYYGDLQALRGVSLTVRQGEIVSVIGGNGAGKTTTLMSVSGACCRRARAARGESLEQAYTLFPRLRERRTQLAGTLSGGEQQMLAIGRGLMGKPTLLMLDEPSLGLAPVMVATMFDTIREINRTGTTILLVEQNVFRALQLSHRGYILENGRIVAEGTSQALLRDPQVRTTYLGL
jgi:branched-chain amino acid transport system ATP-binding protein